MSKRIQAWVLLLTLGGCWKSNDAILYYSDDSNSFIAYNKASFRLFENSSPTLPIEYILQPNGSYFCNQYCHDSLKTVNIVQDEKTLLIKNNVDSFVYKKTQLILPDSIVLESLNLDSSITKRLVVDERLNRFDVQVLASMIANDYFSMKTVHDISDGQIIKYTLYLKRDSVVIKYADSNLIGLNIQEISDAFSTK